MTAIVNPHLQPLAAGVYAWIGAGGDLRLTGDREGHACPISLARRNLVIRHNDDYKDNPLKPDTRTRPNGQQREASRHCA
jgi:hypothetical protein